MSIDIEVPVSSLKKMDDWKRLILVTAGQKAVEAAVARTPARGQGPYATGYMRDHIRGQMTGYDEFTIFCSAPYGMYVEFGTGPKGKASGHVKDFQDDPQLNMKYHTGEVLVTRSGGQLLDEPYVRHTQGMYAAPFMRPALLEGAKWIAKLMNP